MDGQCVVACIDTAHGMYVLWIMDFNFWKDPSSTFTNLKVHFYSSVELRKVKWDRLIKNN